MTQLHGQYLPWMWKADNEQVPSQKIIEIGVQPIQLWSITFPKEFKDVVLTTIFKGNDGQTITPKYKKYFKWLRKALGLQEIPKDYDKSKALPCHVANAHTEMIAIGLKEDALNKDGCEAL